MSIGGPEIVRALGIDPIVLGMVGAAVAAGAAGYMGGLLSAVRSNRAWRRRSGALVRQLVRRESDVPLFGVRHRIAEALDLARRGKRAPDGLAASFFLKIDWAAGEALCLIDRAPFNRDWHERPRASVPAAPVVAPVASDPVVTTASQEGLAEIVPFLSL